MLDRLGDLATAVFVSSWLGGQWVLWSSQGQGLPQSGPCWGRRQASPALCHRDPASVVLRLLDSESPYTDGVRRVCVYMYALEPRFRFARLR